MTTDNEPVGEAPGKPARKRGPSKAAVAAEQRLAACEKALAEAVDKVGAMSRALDDKTKRISNLEISLGALTQEIGKLKSLRDIVGRHDRDVSFLNASSSRRRRNVIFAVAVIILVVAGVVGVQTLGWPPVPGWLAAHAG